MMSKLKKLGVILLITGERENELKKRGINANDLGDVMM